MSAFIAERRDLNNEILKSLFKGEQNLADSNSTNLEEFVLLCSNENLLNT